jgi:hypothetical protein
MTVLRGHFDGKQIVLDEPVPEDLPANARVRVVVDRGGEPSVLDRIAAMARPMNLPADFSVNFKHYTKGAPRR